MTVQLVDQSGDFAVVCTPFEEKRPFKTSRYFSLKLDLLHKMSLDRNEATKKLLSFHQILSWNSRQRTWKKEVLYPIFCTIMSWPLFKTYSGITHWIKCQLFVWKIKKEKKIFDFNITSIYLFVLFCFRILLLSKAKRKVCHSVYDSTS